MNLVIRCPKSALLLLLFVAAILVPLSAEAQTISVTPNPVNVQTSVGTNAPSQILQVRKSGAGSAKWTVTTPTQTWLTVSPTSGVNNNTLTLTFLTSGLAAQAQPYTTSFQVNGPTNSVTVNVSVTISGSTPPPTLTITCPANITVASPNGSPVVVNYTVTTSGGSPPVMLNVSPPSGSSFAVGTTTVQANAVSNDGQKASCSFTVTVTFSPPSGDWTFCASEGQFCAFSGTKQVRYGANNTFVIRTLSGGTPCTNAVFGDPIVGTAKHCDVSTAPTLTITCPANITVASPNGSPVVVTYTVTTSGGSQPVTLNVSPPSGSSFAVGTTTVQANANSNDGQTASCNFTVTVTAPSSDWTFCALEGQFCAFSGTKQVRYGANNTFVVRTISEGTPCTNAVFGDPIPGTAKHCDTNSTVPVSGVGPRAAITCPSGSVNIFPGDFIPSIVSVHPPGATFCLKPGVHFLDRSITPRTGDTFVGEFGAVLDGTPFTTTDDSEGAFRAHNQDVDNITIKNLVIRNMRRAVHGFGAAADRWTIEFNEVGPNYSGVVFPSNSTVRNNFIHHNSFSGYGGVAAHSSIIENNEIANNGWEQKIGLSHNVTFRNNFLHHNAGGGIWYDTDNTGAVIEGNRVEDNGWIGIFYEISADGIIRNNILKRNGDAGVFLSTSKNVQIYNNTFENNFRGITYFMNCGAFNGGPLQYDLTNNTAHDNTITVGTQSGAFASILSFTSDCTATQRGVYLNGSKNLTFSHNAYHVAFPTTGQYWFWGAVKFWNEWQAVPQDLDSTVSQ